LETKRYDGGPRRMPGKAEKIKGIPEFAVNDITNNITDRAQAKDASSESESRLRDFVNNTNDWVWEVDDGFRYTYSNQRGFDLTGYTVEELLGKTMFDFIFPEERERDREAFFGLAYRKEPFRQMEIAVLRKDRRQMIHECTGMPMLNLKGRLLGYRGINRDITERKRAGQELAASEARYRALVETQLEAVCRWLPDTTLTFVNEGYCRICGRERADLVGRKWIEIVPENQHNLILKYVESSVDQPKATTYEHELIGVDERIVQLHWNTYPILDERGRPSEFQSVGRDVTEQKQVEQDLRESEQRFRDLAEKAPVGVYLLEDGVTRYVNQRFADMHGYTVDELIGRSGVRHLVHPEDWEKVEKHNVERLSVKPGLLAPFTFRGITRTGEIIYIETYNCLTIHQGCPAIIGTGVDVTEQKKTEEKLIEYREHLEELVRERTLQLNETNEELQRDIARRKEVERTLEINSTSLQEVNVALKVLLKQRENDRKELEEKVYSNVKELTLRYIHMLKETKVDMNQVMLLDILESNLNNIISPFSKRISFFNFTPKEMEVIPLIKEGKTTKQIAQLLNVCMDAVSRHRYHIRKKLDLNKEKTNLRSYLLNLE
jgi:PAS domain S-box-containing protein